LPAISFVAANTDRLNYAGQQLSFFSDFSVYFLVRRTGGAHMISWGRTDNSIVVNINQSNVFATGQIFDGIVNAEATAIASDASWHVLQMRRTGNTLSIRVDGGTAVTTTAGTQTTTFTNAIIGALFQGSPLNFSTFDVRALIMYSSYHDDTTADEIRTFLRAHPIYGYPNVP